MTHTKKRILAMLLAVVLCFSTLPFSVSADEVSSALSTESTVESQLEELLEGEALRFEAEERTIRIGLADVRVSLRRNTPLQSIGIRPLTASWDIPVRDPVSYIRGLRKLSETGETDE